ncbi:hypothetical protein SFy_4271 [Shigella flexneri 2003036]|nr:hypothetical protein SFy_4271 [Shigella flexneri 2003036]
MSEKTVTGEPRIKLFSGISFRVPAASASLTFRVADNPTEMSSLVIVDKHIAVSGYDSNRLPV